MSWSPQHTRQSNISTMGSSSRPLLHLPEFYARAVFKPIPETFARAAEYARWGLVWLQLLLLVLIPLLLGWLRGTLKDTSTGINTHSNLLFGALDALTVSANVVVIIFKIVFVPLFFFLALTIQYTVARALGGRGRYVSHGFDLLLYQVPLVLIGGLIVTGLVFFHLSTLFFTPIVSLALFCYGFFISISVVMGVHHVSRGKALAAVIIPYILGILAIWGIVTLIARSISNALF